MTPSGPPGKHRSDGLASLSALVQKACVFVTRRFENQILICSSNTQKTNQHIKLTNQLHIKRTNSQNQDFIDLVKELDAFLSIQNGESDDFYSQFNGLEDLHHTIVLYDQEKPIDIDAHNRF